MEKGSYIMTVKLSDKLWRKIQINKTATLDDLHEIILESYDFEDEHLYAFFMDNKAWSRGESYYSPYYDQGPSANNVRLCDLYLSVNRNFLYLYDFGDDWRFYITVFKELTEETEKPKIIDSKGKAPTQYYRS